MLGRMAMIIVGLRYLDFNLLIRDMQIFGLFQVAFSQLGWFK